MLERDDGHIVGIASCAGLIGVANSALYSSSKFAVVGKFFQQLNIASYIYEFCENGGSKAVINGLDLNISLFRSMKTIVNNIKNFEQINCVGQLTP